jgi:hypothetical protein
MKIFEENVTKTLINFYSLTVKFLTVKEATRKHKLIETDRKIIKNSTKHFFFIKKSYATFSFKKIYTGRNY